jgi:hypothetical protein
MSGHSRDNSLKNKDQNRRYTNVQASNLPLVSSKHIIAERSIRRNSKSNLNASNGKFIFNHVSNTSNISGNHMDHVSKSPTPTQKHIQPATVRPSTTYHHHQNIEDSSLRRIESDSRSRSINKHKRMSRE